MLLDGANVVSIDLGDVDQSHPAVFELQERSVRRDASDRTGDDRSDLYLGDWDSSPNGDE